MPYNKVFLLVLDGYGLRDSAEGNAVKQARTPFLHGMFDRFGWTTIGASGNDVGLPVGQMGNSEVGHLNLGAGRIVYQDITRIDRAISTGEFFTNPALVASAGDARSSAWHLIGLVSDGGVHSSLDHLYALLELAKREAVGRVYVHALTDGRDTPPHSAASFITGLERRMREIGVGSVATVCGRYWAMDRDTRWDRIERAYRAITAGEGLNFASAVEAIEDSYRRDVTDEFIEPSVIVKGGKPAAAIQGGDSVLFFNFRADRARQLTRALYDRDFDQFWRPNLELDYTTMTVFHEDFECPAAFPPTRHLNVLGQTLADAGLKQFRVAETEKYAHVTFFFNGGQETPFPGEERALVPSPRVPTYDLQPEMSAAGVAARAMDALEEDYNFILLNFANPDMVGHTGSIDAAVKALEALDPLVEELVMKAASLDWTTLITADHGNCEEMLDRRGEMHTYHTTNPVPFVVIVAGGIKPKLRGRGILADVAPTVLALIGVRQPSEMEGKSIIVSG